MYPAFGATLLICVCHVALPVRRSWRRPAPHQLQQHDSGLDTLMKQVLARREVNRVLLNQYVLDETESFEMLGPGRTPLHRMKREFTWYTRDGMHVRSPVRFDGVAIGETARRQYEDATG